MDILLQLDNLNVTYDEVPILRDFSMHLCEGEILGVVGESGSGKSTTINCCMGLLGSDGRIEKGYITYKGKDILTMGKRELRDLRGREMCLISQNPRDMFHPMEKIRKQLKQYVKSHGGMDYKEAEKQILSIMEKINLINGDTVLNSYPYELSGGMCQRVAIAFSMLYNPSLLFADEPTSALDVTSQLQVVEELTKIRSEFGTAIMIVSHNIGVISYLADRIIVMLDGIIVEEGRTSEVLKHAYHPYTRNLIRAIPQMGEKPPLGIRNYPVDHFSKGCPICQECENYTETCTKTVPPLRLIAEDHYVRCCNPEVNE